MPILRAGPFGQRDGDEDKKYFQLEPDEPTVLIQPINCANKSTTRWVWGCHELAQGQIDDEESNIIVNEYSFEGSGTVTYPSGEGTFNNGVSVSFGYQATEDFTINGTASTSDGDPAALTYRIRKYNETTSGQITDGDLAEVTLPASGGTPIFVTFSADDEAGGECEITYDINA
jgi:hypothetical protein